MSSDVLIVAEIGNNHEGDAALAVRLVELAADAGAGAVKLQTFRASEFVRPVETERMERMTRFELPPEAVRRVHRAAKARGLVFISTPLDFAAVDLLRPLVDRFKIASGDNDHYPLIERVCSTGIPIILSTGLADLAQISRTVAFIRDQWRARGVAPELSVLHCVTSYPVPDEEANLAAVGTIARALPGVTVGYSDHTLGIEACVLAVTLGARVIEKHFTLDKRQSTFRDHALSADPPELAELVRRVRTARMLLGSGEKVVQPAERDFVVAARRSIVAAADLPAGHLVTWRDLAWMRPADGLRPGEEQRLVGKRLVRSVVLGETLRASDVR